MEEIKLKKCRALTPMIDIHKGPTEYQECHGFLLSKMVGPAYRLALPRTVLRSARSSTNAPAGPKAKAKASAKAKSRPKKRSAETESADADGDASKKTRRKARKTRK